MQIKSSVPFELPPNFPLEIALQIINLNRPKAELEKTLSACIEFFKKNPNLDYNDNEVIEPMILEICACPECREVRRLSKQTVTNAGVKSE